MKRKRQLNEGQAGCIAVTAKYATRESCQGKSVWSDRIGFIVWRFQRFCYYVKPYQKRWVSSRNNDRNVRIPWKPNNCMINIFMQNGVLSMLGCKRSNASDIFGCEALADRGCWDGSSGWKNISLCFGAWYYGTQYLHTGMEKQSSKLV